MKSYLNRRRFFALLIAVALIGLSAGTAEGGTYSGGTGEPNDPFRIATAEDLNDIGNHPNDWPKHFKMMADIDLSGYDGQDGRPAFNIIAPDINDSAGGFQGTAFTGIFDGNDYIIYNFTINAVGTNSDYLGLFGRVDSSGEIKNLNLENMNIIAGHSCNYLGGLVGDNHGNITHCSIAGTVTDGGGYYIGGLAGNNSGYINHCNVACSVSGVSEVGGLVGSNYDGTISNCNATTGTVTGSGYVGGLVGSNYNDDTISNCSATGPVIGIEYPGIVGGLVGYSGGNITNSYATGSVTGGYASDYFGGLVGFNNGIVSYCYATGSVTGGDESTQLGGLAGIINHGSITNCYATGAVTGGNNSYSIGGLTGGNAVNINNCYATGNVSGSINVGSFAGSDYGGSYTACFWNSDVNPDVNGIGNATDPNVIGKSTANMQTWSTFASAGWDFNTPIWTIDEGVDYPRLWWEMVVGPVELVDELADDVFELGLPQGISNSLGAKLDTALKVLDDENENNDAAAINSLGAFINAVKAQSGKKIPEDDAEVLIAAAQAIIDLLSGE